MGFSPFTSKPAPPIAPTRSAPPPPLHLNTETAARPSSGSNSQRNRQQSHESFISATQSQYQSAAGSPSSPRGQARGSPPHLAFHNNNTRDPSSTNVMDATGGAGARRKISKQASLTNMVDAWTAGQMQLGMQRSSSGESRSSTGSGGGGGVRRPSEGSIGNGNLSEDLTYMGERQRSPSRVTFANEVQVQFIPPKEGETKLIGHDGSAASGSGSSTGGGGFRSLFTRKKTVRTSVDPSTLTGQQQSSTTNPSSSSSTSNTAKKHISRSKSNESLKRDRALQQRHQREQTEPNPVYYPYNVGNQALAHSSKTSQGSEQKVRSATISGTPSWRLPDETDPGLTIMGSEANNGGSKGRRLTQGSPGGTDGAMERKGSQDSESRRGSEDGGERESTGLRVSGESVRSGRSSVTARSPSPSRSPLSQVAFTTSPAYPTARAGPGPSSSSSPVTITIQRPSSSSSPQGTAVTSTSTPSINILGAAPFGTDSPHRPYRSRTSSRPSPSASPTSPAFSHFASANFLDFVTTDPESIEPPARDSMGVVVVEKASSTSTTDRAGRAESGQEAWLGASLISTSPLSLEDAVFGNAEDTTVDQTDVSPLHFDAPPRTPPAAHTTTVDPSHSPYRPTFGRSNVQSSIYADDEDSVVVKPKPTFMPTKVLPPQTNRRSSRRMSGQGLVGAGSNGNKRESIIIRSQQGKMVGGNGESSRTSWSTSIPSFDSGNSIMSLASLGIVLPTEDLAEIADRDARARAEVREDTAFVPMFNIIPATPVINAAEFAGSDPRRQSWEIGMEDVKMEATPRRLEDALELNEEVLARANEEEASTPKLPEQAFVSRAAEEEPAAANGMQLPSATLNSHKPTSSVSSATSTSAVSDTSSCSFGTMTSMTSLSTSSTASSFPDVEEALGAMLASLSAGGNGPHELMTFPDYMMAGDDGEKVGKTQSEDELRGWAGLGFDFGGHGEDIGTPTLGDKGGFGFGLGLGLEQTSRQFSVTSPLVLPTERTPMVNHKVPFYGKAKAFQSTNMSSAAANGTPGMTVDFTPDETPRQNGIAESSGLFESSKHGGRSHGHASPLGNSHSRNDSIASVASSACESSMTSSSSMSSLSDMDDIENASISIVANKGQFANSRTVQYSPQVQAAVRSNGQHGSTPRGEFGIGWAM